MVFPFQFLPSMRGMRCGFFLEVIHIDMQAFRIWIDICVNLNQQFIERLINIMHLAQALEMGVPSSVLELPQIPVMVSLNCVR